MNWVRPPDLTENMATDLSFAADFIIDAENIGIVKKKKKWRRMGKKKALV